MMNRYLKKLSSIIFVLLLLSGNAYAQKIRLTCDGINTQSLPLFNQTRASIDND